MKTKKIAVLAAVSCGLLLFGFQNCSKLGSVPSSTLKTLSSNTGVPPLQPPATPLNFTAEAVAPGMVKLTWDPPPGPVTTFEIEWLRPGGNWAPGVNTVGTFTTFTWSGNLDPSVPYSFRIAATNAAGTSTFSDTVAVMTLATPITVTKPISPSNLRIVNVTDTQVDLAWTDNSDNETRFRVLRRKEGEQDFSELFDTEPNVTTHSDINLDPGTAYEYIVVSSNGAGHFPEEAEESVRTLPAGTPAPAVVPSGLTLTPVSETQIDISWNLNTYPGVSFRLMRYRTLSGALDVVAELNSSSGTYSDSLLTPGRKYNYMITIDGMAPRRYLFDNAWTHFPSGMAPPVVPSAPTGLTAQAVSSTEVQLNWDSQPCDPYTCQFYVERSLTPNGPFKGVNNSSSYSVRDAYGLQPGTTYYYRITIRDQGGQSFYSATATATTLP